MGRACFLFTGAVECFIIKAIPHNSKYRYGERGAAAAKPKAQIILCAAKVSAASGGNSEPKQGQRSQSARGFCPRSTMRVPQPDIIEHFGNADAVPHTEPQRGASERNRRLRRLLARRSAGAVLKPLGGNCAVLPKIKITFCPGQTWHLTHLCPGRHTAPAVPQG